ncbi:hypothetical protein SEA_MADAMATO_67 [Streptomyces phage Madamato]|nr:hypothetical protein SEA_MADAMATO_67 [Streptomyces phage Madamato]
MAEDLSGKDNPNFIGEVPVRNRIEGSAEEGEIIGTAKVEKTKSGSFVYHMTLEGQTARDIQQGYSFGSFSIAEEPDEGAV